MCRDKFADEKMNVPEYALRVLNRLNGAGYEGYLVGGCVRDFLMGRGPKDYDVATNASAEQTEAAFKDFHVIETGIKHGTVTVMSDGMPIEVTTYRVDGTYSDGRHPDSVTFSSSLKEDMSRRDFTMNAIAYSPNIGLVDVFGGVEDIRRGVIRCVGGPDRRFNEDALRIMRALRFAAVLGFEIDGQTAESIHRNRGLLHKIAAERITAELFALICGKNAAQVMREYSDVMAEILPPLKDMFGFEQDNPHHIYDVWEHTLHAVENVPPTVEMRMAALLHDAGKPHCKTVDENGVGHFYGHADISAEIAEDVFKNHLRTSKSISDRIVTLVKNHDETFILTKKIMRRRLMKYGEETLRQLLDLSRGDVRGQGVDVQNRLEQLDEAERILNEILSQETCLSLKAMAINGRDLSELGIERGKIMGDILNRLLEEINDEAIENTKEALSARAMELYRQNRS